MRLVKEEEVVDSAAGGQCRGNGHNQACEALGRSMLGKDFMEEETIEQSLERGDPCQKVKRRSIPGGGEGADKVTELSTSMGQMEKQ